MSGRVFSVERHSVREPGGVSVVREIIRHPGAAVILPVADDGGVLLVRQYRLAAGSSLWELPAGTLDKGPRETVLAAARRELQEETGFSAARWRKLIEFFPSPGILTERMTLFLAQGLRPGSAQPESDERISARFFSLPELLARMQTGRIRDAKTLIGILYWQLWRGDGRRSSQKKTGKDASPHV